MASHLNLFDLDSEVLVLVLKNSSLVKQWTLRRVCKQFQGMIQDEIWPKNEIIWKHDFENPVTLPMQEIWEHLLPRMPKIKMIQLDFNQFNSNNKYNVMRCDEIVLAKLLAEHCPGIIKLETSSSVIIKTYAIELLKLGIDLTDREFQVPYSSIDNLESTRGLKISAETEPMIDNPHIYDNLNIFELSYPDTLHFPIPNILHSPIPDTVRVLETNSYILDDDSWIIPTNVTSLSVLGVPIKNRFPQFTNLDQLALEHFEYFRNIYPSEERFDAEETMITNLEDWLAQESCKIVKLRLSIRFRSLFDRFITFITGLDRKWKQLIIHGFDKNFYLADNYLSYESNDAIEIGADFLDRFLGNCPKVRTIVIKSTRTPRTKLRRPMTDEKIAPYKLVMENLSRPRRNVSYSLRFVTFLKGDYVLATGGNWKIVQNERK